MQNSLSLGHQIT